MNGTMLYDPHDVRFEESETPKMAEPTDAIIPWPEPAVTGQ